MDENPLRVLIDLSTPLTEETLGTARRYVQQRSAILAWHQLYRWPALRQYGARAVSVGLDGFDTGRP